MSFGFQSEAVATPGSGGHRCLIALDTGVDLDRIVIVSVRWEVSASANA